MSEFVVMVPAGERFDITLAYAAYLWIHPIRCGSEGQLASRFAAASPASLIARPGGS